jgi:hypothetical protein
LRRGGNEEAVERGEGTRGLPEHLGAGDTWGHVRNTAPALRVEVTIVGAGDTWRHVRNTALALRVGVTIVGAGDTWRHVRNTALALRVGITIARAGDTWRHVRNTVPALRVGITIAGAGVRLQSPRRRFLGQGNGLSVYLVDGERVRNEIDVDFVNGGNAAVYPRYIPHDEIWIDDAQHPLDRTATALHELVERDLMLHHGRGYDSAHDLANMYERAFRRMLRHHRPRTYNSRMVMDAYRAYLCDRGGPKTARQLDHEIAGALRRRFRSSPRCR